MERPRPGHRDRDIPSLLERYLDFVASYDIWPRLDLLIYTPAEFEQMRPEGRPFIEHVLSEGVPVHETLSQG